MSSADPLGDDELLAAVGRMLDADDPVPSQLHAHAVALFEVGFLDAELAELVHDSLIDASPHPVRSGDEPVHVVVAAAEHVSIELVFHEFGRLVGQVVPAGTANVEIQFDDTTTMPVDVDAYGEFEVVVTPRPLRCIVRSASSIVVTPWVHR